MKIYIGDASIAFTQFVLQKDPTAVLCENDNIDNILSSNLTAYTSIFHVTRENFGKLCLAATEIELYNLTWHDQNAERETQQFIDLFFSSKTNKLYNSIISESALVGERKTNKSQIWAIGCSYTSAVGVTDNDRWANKLAKKLDKEVTILAFPGASIQWTADQLLRSDLQPGDTVFWLLTTTDRIDYYSESDQNVKIHSNLSVYEEDRTEILKLSKHEHTMLMQLLTHRWNVYKSINIIRQVINYCNKLGVQLYIGQALRNDTDTDTALMSLLRSYPRFVLPFSVKLYYNNFMLDRGTDNQHPGPKTHQYIADEFYQAYIQLCSLK